MPRRTRSISTPIILTSVAVALSIALLVGWTIVIVTSLDPVGSIWLVVGGGISILVIMTVLVLFGVQLAREILEGRRQSRFIDSVTHELKSPLASLRLCLETLDREGLEEEQTERIHRMMRLDVERLAVFIDDVLVASRIAHGSQALSFAEVDLDSTVERCLEKVAVRYEVGEDAFTVEIPDDLRLETDDTALETILLNLIDNAVKYSDEPVDVRIAARRRDGEVVIEVTDRGIGIPERDRTRIFKRFYRVDDEAVRTRRGSGLGLYVVKALVDQLEGTLEPLPRDGEDGTRMVLTLPDRDPA